MLKRHRPPLLPPPTPPAARIGRTGSLLAAGFSSAGATPPSARAASPPDLLSPQQQHAFPSFGARRRSNATFWTSDEDVLAEEDWDFHVGGGGGGGGGRDVWERTRSQRHNAQWSSETHFGGTPASVGEDLFEPHSLPPPPSSPRFASSTISKPPCA